MKLSLAQELMLLALKDDKGTLATESSSLKIGLAGSLIMELLFDDRIMMVDNKVQVLNPSTHPDAFLEETLGYIRDSKKPRKLKDWVSRINGKMPKLIKEMTHSLVIAGILHHEEDKVLWVFPHHKFPTNDATPELLIRRRIENVVLGGNTPDERTSALISIALACQLTGELFEKSDRKEAKKRMKAISKASESSVVGKVIDEMHAAVATVIVVAGS
ncbi:MAG TPA: GPP34 family phosphoprotein [Bacteroidetes bacterium]|nr:Golgi phosphoprotein 3 [bacterium BMS3Bbin04]HDO66492.1 GPP34 family phosphoprotein [Bacteroidota bacterium]HEX05617.1 GPP34 family phosphoprotein [Bacteroidota bacterium]